MLLGPGVAVMHILLVQTSNKIRVEEEEVKHHVVEEEGKKRGSLLLGRSEINPAEGGDVPSCSLQFFSVLSSLNNIDLNTFHMLIHFRTDSKMWTQLQHRPFI